jgi:hypothetical protein
MYRILAAFLLTLILFSGCINYYDSPQPIAQSQSNPISGSLAQQNDNTCPPSIDGCNTFRGAANQISIQCKDGRQYTRGTSGQILIQYPGKQIEIGAAGQELIQGFNNDEAQCLIGWLKKF